MTTEKRIYWTTSRASDRYVIWVDGKVYADHLTMDELFATWKTINNLP